MPSTGRRPCPRYHVTFLQVPELFHDHVTCVFRYHDEALVSVGGESYITYWDVHPSSGDSGLTAKGRAMSSASALYAALPVSMAQESALECQVDSRGALVVAGEAPRVDFFMTPSSRTLSFSV